MIAAITITIIWIACTAILAATVIGSRRERRYTRTPDRHDIVILASFEYEQDMAEARTQLDRDEARARYHASTDPEAVALGRAIHEAFEKAVEADAVEADA